jgi:hypothetical protein
MRGVDKKGDLGDILDRRQPVATFVEATCARKGQRILPIECGYFFAWISVAE